MVVEVKMEKRAVGQGIASFFAQISSEHLLYTTLIPRTGVEDR